MNCQANHCYYTSAVNSETRVLADVEMIQTVSSHSNYGLPRFITILQFKFTHESADIISDDAHTKL